MSQHIMLYGKSLRVDLSPVAQRALQQRTTPLLAEIHLIFACLIVKRVRFKDAVGRIAIPVTDKLFVNFRPVRYQKSCRLADIDADENPEDFPLAVARGCFVPDHLHIDFSKGGWRGDFTYDRAISAPV